LTDQPGYEISDSVFSVPLLANQGALRTQQVQFAEVAQAVEQGTENPRVGSSNLSLGTKNK
jgi:hypothetical protein